MKTPQMALLEVVSLRKDSFGPETGRVAGFIVFDENLQKIDN